MTTSQTDSAWFEDEDRLVQALRRVRRANAPPSIPGYDELSELRRGGQGVVFVGRQLSTRRRVAIKLVLEGSLASREARRRFEREIELVVTLRHPHIVRVYDSGETEDGRLFYIMEYIEGAGLDELIESLDATDGGDLRPVRTRPVRALSGGEPVDWQAHFPTRRDLLSMFAKICDAVLHAHQQGVIHRDLKPSNIRIDLTGEPHVLDFGLAKLNDPLSDASRVSESGRFMGSLPWASPEQAEGAIDRIDTRSDVYSLGVILFQLLTGEFPYPVAGPLREVLGHIQQTPPRSPREIHRHIDDEASTIVLKCLSKEPDRRYQSAGDLARDIRHYLAGEPIEAKRDSAWYSVRKTLDRYRTAVRAVSALLVASLLFSVAMVLLRARAIDAERLAASRLHDLEIAHRAEVAAREALEQQVRKTRGVSEFLDQTLRAVDPWMYPGRDLGPLRELLDNAVRRLDGAFPDQPDVEAAIAGTLGWDYRELGIYEPAETLLRRSYELYAKTIGESAMETFVALGNLAMFMTDRGRHAEAEAMFRRLRLLQEETLGAEHPATLVTLNNLALDLDWQGRSAEAEALYRQALEGQRRLLGPNHRDTLHTLNNLAACLPALGKVDEAEALHHELIRGRTMALGADHPETLQARMNLADLLRERGRLEEAETILRDLVASFDKALSQNHPLKYAAIHNLASVVTSRGRHEEGLALARKAFEAHVAFAGPDDPRTLNRKNALACSLVEMKKWDEAIPLAKELCEQYQRVLGDQDWRTLNARGNLAFALRQFGRPEEAEQLWRDILSKASPDVPASIEPLRTAQINLGYLLMDQARWEEADAMLTAAMQLQRDAGEGDHWRAAYIQAGLGRIAYKTNRLAEAQSQLESAYRVLSGAFADEHEKTQRVISDLVDLYETLGDGAKAAAFRAKINSPAAVIAEP